MLHLADRDSKFLVILTPPWTPFFAVHDRAYCSAPQRAKNTIPITGSRIAPKARGIQLSEASLSASRRFLASTFALALERCFVCWR